MTMKRNHLFTLIALSACSLDAHALSADEFMLQERFDFLVTALPWSLLLFIAIAAWLSPSPSDERPCKQCQAKASTTGNRRQHVFNVLLVTAVVGWIFAIAWSSGYL